MAASQPAPAPLPAISLPSSLKAARVSLSSSPAESQQQSQQPSPFSQLSLADNAARRVSGSNSNGSGGVVAGGPSRMSSSVPGILPNSAFLTPRKPAGVAARQNQLRPGAGSVSLASSASSRSSSNNGNGYGGPSSARASIGSQSSYVPAANAADGAAAGVTMFPVIDEDTPVSQYGQSYGRSAPGSSHLTGDTLGRSGSLGGHTRAESRQDTIRSKASREPLIGNGQAYGLPKRAGSGSTAHRPEHGKRKNSKTGSITSLLGFGGQKSSESTSSASGAEGRPGRKASRSVGSSGMATVREREGKAGEEKLPAGSHQPNINGRARSHEHAFDADPPFWNSTDERQPSHRAIAMPVLDEKTHKPLRNYQLYDAQQRASRHPALRKRTLFERLCARRPPGHADADGKIEPLAFGYGTDHLGGNNRFLLSGRLVTSGDSPYPFLGALAVAVFMPGIFLAFEAEWLWSSDSNAGGGIGGIGTAAGKALVVLFAYCTLIMWSSMLRTSLRDPGIIPKGLDREPDFESMVVPVGCDEDITGTGMGQRPRMRHLRVRGEIVGSKWCETCQSYRPPRTSHCRLCDVCTEQTDHHCSFLNNCIGRRNYPSFAAFLLSACADAALVIGISIAHLVLRGTQLGADEFWTSWRTIGSLVVLVVTFAAAMPIMALTGYHGYLVWQGRTTIETIRPKYDSENGRPVNLFSHKRRIDNIVAALFRPMDLHSALQSHKFAEKDAREENPAFAHP